MKPRDLADEADILAEMLATPPSGFVAVYVPATGAAWLTKEKLFPPDVRAAWGAVDVTPDLVAELRSRV